MAKVKKLAKKLDKLAKKVRKSVPTKDDDGAYNDLIYASTEFLRAFGIEVSNDSLFKVLRVLNKPKPVDRPIVKFGGLTFVNCTIEGDFTEFEGEQPQTIPSYDVSLRLSDFKDEKGNFRVPDKYEEIECEGYVFDAKGEPIAAIEIIYKKKKKQVREVFYLHTIKETKKEEFPSGYPFGKCYPSIESAMAALIAQPFMPE